MTPDTRHARKRLLYRLEEMGDAPMRLTPTMCTGYFELAMGALSAAR